MTGPRQLVIEPAQGRALTGRLRAPGDKSISHRALLIGARAEGRSRIRGLSNGADVRHTFAAVVALGAGAEARRPQGLGVVGGLLLSLAITLYVTPVFFTWLDRFQAWTAARSR